MSAYTVVHRARAAARFLPEEGFEFTLLSAPDLSGPTRVRMTTRYVNGGHANPLPRELLIEVVGPAPSIDIAIARFSALAHAFAFLAAFVANVQVGIVEPHLAFDSSEGKDEREFVEVFLPDQVGGVSGGRGVRPPLMVAFTQAYVGSSDYARITRAVQQYGLALREWYIGGEYLALSHLFMAVEALVPLAVTRRLADDGLTLPQLAEFYEIEMEGDRAYRGRQLLDAQVRLDNIFESDVDTHRTAKKASDGLEHGFLNLSEVAKHAIASADKTFHYVRKTILWLLRVPEPEATELLNIKVLDVESLRKMIRGRLVNAASGELAAENETYPIVEWGSSIKGVIREGRTIRFENSEKFKFRFSPGVRMHLDRLEVIGRVEEGHVPVELQVSDESSEPDHPPIARDLMESTLAALQEATTNGVEREMDVNASFAFYLFGLGSASFEAAKALLERDQPIEAAANLRTLITVAARMEQMSAGGVGVATRGALEYFESIQQSGALSVSDPEAVRRVVANCEEIIKRANDAGVIVPDRLGDPSTTAIWTALGAELALSQLVLDASHGAAAGHLVPGEEPGHVEFRTSTKQDRTSDLIASAAVIAELHNVRIACDLFGWNYDSGHLDALMAQAKALNAAAACGK